MYYKDENSVFYVVDDTSFVFVQGSVVGRKYDNQSVSEILSEGMPISEEEFFDKYNDAINCIKVNKIRTKKIDRTAPYHINNGNYYFIINSREFQELNFATKKRYWYKGNLLALDMVKNYKTSTKKQFEYYLNRLKYKQWIYR